LTRTAPVLLDCGRRAAPCRLRLPRAQVCRLLLRCERIAWRARFGSTLAAVQPPPRRAVLNNQQRRLTAGARSRAGDQRPTPLARPGADQDHSREDNLGSLFPARRRGFPTHTLGKISVRGALLESRSCAPSLFYCIKCYQRLRPDYSINREAHTRNDKRLAQNLHGVAIRYLNLPIGTAFESCGVVFVRKSTNRAAKA